MAVEGVSLRATAPPAIDPEVAVFNPTNSLRYTSDWNGHAISMESKTFGGWPGVGLLGGSHHHSVRVDGRSVAHREGSQAGSLLEGLLGRKMELTGTFKGSDGTSHDISVWFPWSTPYCEVTIDDAEPFRVVVTF